MEDLKYYNYSKPGYFQDKYLEPKVENRPLCINKIDYTNTIYRIKESFENKQTKNK
jgi:hypothetical protein